MYGWRRCILSFGWWPSAIQASVGVATRVLAIPAKRTDKRLLGYLSRPEMDALLNGHDLSQWAGRRDHALLLTLYNTGARVSEMTGLQRSQVQFGTKSFVQFKGKGRKERAVPLWPSTSRTLQGWFAELDADARYRAAVAFPNARGAALSRDGVDYLLQQAVNRSATLCPSIAHKRVTPHLIRHTSAMHLLQAGVDITIIALWLGHERYSDHARLYRSGSGAQREGAQKSGARRSKNKTISGR